MDQRGKRRHTVSSPPRTWSNAGLVLSIALLAFPSGGQAAAAEWWKEPAPSSRLDERHIDASGRTATRLQWDDGYIEVKAGATADPRVALNAAHTRSLALTAARHLAYLKLAEVVDGVSIDGTTTVRNAMVESQVVRTTVRARITGARVVSEDARTDADGAVWADVVVGLRLRGGDSVAESLAPWLASRPADAYAADPTARVAERYTGLVVEASDAGYSPALAPRLIEETTGKVIFGPHLVLLASLSQSGPVGYAPGIDAARTGGRVGGNPLVVRAVGASGSRKGDLLISGRDAERILAADSASGFLARGAVVLVLGKERQELAGQPGRTYALIVGIGEYAQGGMSAPPRLSYPARDAASVAQVMRRRAGVEADALQVLTDAEATRERIVGALRTLRGRVAETDRVIIYFSGHGAVGLGDDGRPHYFLVPVDGRLSDLARTALTDDLVEELVGQIAARQVTIMLDTCYAGAGSSTVRARGIPRPDGVPVPARTLIDPSAGRVVMSASRPDQLAFEDDQRGAGVFTSFVLEGLEGPADLDADGVITALELFQYVSPRVREYSRQQFQIEQTPTLDVRGLAGELIIAGRR